MVTSNGISLFQQRADEMKLRDLELARERASMAISDAVSRGASDSEVDLLDGDFRAAQRNLVEALQEQVEAGYKAPTELIQRTSMFRYVEAALNETEVDGAERELLQELGLKSKINGQQPVPVVALLKGAAARQRPKGKEDRADANTTLAPGSFEANVRDPILPVYAGTDLTFLGIDPVLVPVGASRVPVITDGNKATPIGRSRRVDAQAATIVAREFNPKEIRKRFRYSAVENYQWGIQIESSLTEVLRRSLMERLDDMAIIGDGNSGEDPQPLGLYNSFKGTGLPSDPSGQTTWPDYVSALSGEVDGKFASSEAGMRLLVGIKTWAHARTQYRGADSTVDAIQALRNMGADVRATTRIPAPSSDKQDAILSLSQQASLEGYFVGLWNAFLFLRDPYTESSAGDVSLTATMFYDAGGLRRPADTTTNANIEGIHRLRFQLA